MERSEWDDDDQYPAAPLPAHERRWRHPSEVGNHAWAQGEPALTIGRGLSAATGAIGVALTLAVLWAMLPTEAGRSAVVSVRSTLVAGPANGLLGEGTTGIEPTSVLSTSGANEPATDATVLAGTISTEPVAAQTMPTYQINHVTTLEPSAVAVAVDGGNLVVTTAGAVGDDLALELLLPDGTVAQADVLLVDQLSGLAVLAPDSVDGIARFTVATKMEPGDVLTVYGSNPMDITVDPAGNVATEWPGGDTISEGTPVVNQRGELVALCTHSAGGTSLVAIDNLNGLRRALGAALPPPVWLGVVLNDDPGGSLVVGAVDPVGPAAGAGLEVGDSILAIDGRRMIDLTELAGTLALHRPGDKVSIALLCSDGTTSTVLVELAAPRPSL